MKKPWRKLNSKIAYKNPYWHVVKDKVIQPDGNKGAYHFVQLNDFASTFILDKDGKSTYLTRQYRYPVGKNSWENPQGLIDRGETPLQGAKRELEEETGFKAKWWKKIGFAYIANGLTNQGFHIFVAQDLAKGEQRLEGSEADMIVKKFPIVKVRKMIEKGEISDAPAIVTFHFVEKYLKRLL